MAAEALLEMVAGNLISFMQEELSTIWGVDSQIKKLSNTLTAISAVLQDVEEENQITPRGAKIWLQNLSDAAHVLDDILDECSIQSNLLQSRNMCLSPKTILFRRDIGKRMKEIVTKFEEIDQVRKMFKLHQGVVMKRQPEGDHGRRETCSVIAEPDMYGRDQDKEQIVEFLLSHASDDGELSVYPIVGMGGIGKTTLARWVFNDGRIIEQFQLSIWVSVSYKFDVMRILRDIVESIKGEKPDNSTLQSMLNKLGELLSSDKRYLLVLDDVWNEEKEKWDDLKSVLLKCFSATKGASILVTTRLDVVASIMGTHQTHPLSPLSEDDNWSVFKQHAFGPNGKERAELVAIGREIVRKCVGSPLASRALGSALHDVKEEKHWLNIKESKFWDIPEGERVMGALKISYFNLNLSLRRCFSFCAIYPEDFQIEKEQLIHLWMANGFIKSNGEFKDVEDVGNKVWGDLCKRSFFQEVKIDLLGNTTFKIHDLFHELAQSVMGEECKASDSEGLNNLSSRVHHISCSGAQINIDTHAFKELESLRTFVEHDCLFNSSYGLKAFKNSLRALCTSSSQLSDLGSLTHLRYLNIYMLDIRRLPECVCRLQRLQILKLQNCSNLSCLPKQLTQLKDLRHLLIRWCNSLVDMPSNIGELKHLKTLNIFIMNSKRQTSLAELRGLQLGGKLHIKGLENVRSESDARSANLMSKELSQLYFSWACSSESKCTNSEKILEDLKPHYNLKSFGMKGYMGKNFPSWMMNTSVLSCLVSVILYDCKNCEQLPPLGKLPNLTNLIVSGMENVKHIDGDSYDGVEEKPFKSLKKLTLFRLPNLERMLSDDTVDKLPLVSQLRISCVPKLRSLPLLPSVELLHIKGWKSGSNDDDMARSLEAIMKSVPHVRSLSFSNLSGVNVSLDGLSSLNSLEVLQIHDCDELVSFKESVLEGLSSLRTLTIYECEKLKSLPQGMGHLTCLENLTIYDCQELVTLPNNMDQLTALRFVLICGCLTLPEGLQRLPSLECLTIRDIKADSLPELLADMTSLQMLAILKCPNIRSLPSSFQHLTNRCELFIVLCPKLEEWCKRRTGEDWGKLCENIPQSQDEITHFQKFWLCEDYEHYWNINKSAGYSKFDELVDEIE